MKHMPGLTPVAIVGAIIRNSGRVLMGLRSPNRRTCANCWDVIGGHVESGEELFAALCRELVEEIGIVPDRTEPLCSLNLTDSIEGRMLLHLYVIDRWAGTPRLVNDEHTELRWFPSADVAALPNLAIPEYKAIFAGL